MDRNQMNQKNLDNTKILNKQKISKIISMEVKLENFKGEANKTYRK
jgi:hypothetical protein